MSAHHHDHAPHDHDRHDHGHAAHAPGAAHAHTHDHHDDERRLLLALLLTGGFMVAEVVGGLLANSLALLADAGHMLTDAAALALSLFVAWFSRQPSAPEKTYGYLRAEILAALVNGATLLGVSGVILWEAVARMRAPEPVASGLMLGVAVAGLVVNVVAAWVLHGGAGQSLNHRGAYLHVIGDLLASVGTVAAALIVRATGAAELDPVTLIGLLASNLEQAALAPVLEASWRERGEAALQPQPQP